MQTSIKRAIGLLKTSKRNNLHQIIGFVSVFNCPTATYTTANHKELELILKQELFPSDTSAPSPIFASPPAKLPSVSKILGLSKSEESVRALEKWKQNMIAELGFDGFQKYQQELFRNGKQIHSKIESYLREKDEEKTTPPGIVGYWESVHEKLDGFASPLATECHLKHKNLLYHGIADCITNYKSNLCLVEWKTSTHKKSSLKKTYDHPIQVAAYTGMWNNTYPQNQVNTGALVIMYSDGTPCDIIRMTKSDLQYYWMEWLNRVRRYWEIQLDVPSW